jgi:hypothetical protein
VDEAQRVAQVAYETAQKVTSDAVGGITEGFAAAAAAVGVPPAAAPEPLPPSEEDDYDSDWDSQKDYAAERAAAARAADDVALGIDVVDDAPAAAESIAAQSTSIELGPPPAPPIERDVFAEARVVGRCRLTLSNPR